MYKVHCDRCDKANLELGINWLTVKHGNDEIKHFDSMKCMFEYYQERECKEKIPYA